MDRNGTSISAEKPSIYSSLNMKRRPDGSLYKSRLEMKKAYNDSKLPYPLNAVFKLDYCFNIVKSHFFNSFFFSVPLTLVLSYAINPRVRTEGMKSRPISYYISLYLLVYSSMSLYFAIDSLMFCDYCKPWSSVYDSDNKNETYKQILKNRIKSEQSGLDAKIKKTKDKGLKEDEI
jgi:hypothetical protein